MPRKIGFVSLIMLAVLLAGCIGGNGAPTGNLQGQIFDAATNELITESVTLTLGGKELIVKGGTYSFTDR